jgi:hypothetical protein
MERTAFVVSACCYNENTEKHDSRVRDTISHYCKEGWSVVLAETRVSALGNFIAAYFATTVVIEKKTP